MRPFRNEPSRGRNYASNNSPMFNDQLQDLDMELEILKRQREIIKQKQRENMNMTQRQGKYQPSASYGRQEPNQQYNFNTNFSNNYNSNNKKRPADRNWQTPTVRKQSNLQINPWNNQYNNQGSIALKPLLGFHVEPIRTRVQRKPTTTFKNTPKPRPDFRPTKVSKSKKVIPNKLHTYAPEETKKLVSETFKSTKVYDSTQILRPDVEPSPQMKGRLELALGQIMKTLRESKSVEEDILERLKTHSAQRAVKNVIRQRITDLMMNKVVGNCNDIVVIYRKDFPNDIDEEIIKVVKAVQQQPLPYSPPKLKPITAKETEDIRIFFKTRINELLKDKMQEMIDNLGKMYGDNELEILQCIDEMPDIHLLTGQYDTKKIENENNTKENVDKNTDTAMESIEENGLAKEVCEAKEIPINAEEKKGEEISGDLNKSQDTIEDDKVILEAKLNDKTKKVEAYYKLMELLLLNRLPKVLYRLKDELVKMLYCEKDFIVAKEMVMLDVKEELKKAYLAANSIENESKVTCEDGDNKQEIKITNGSNENNVSEKQQPSPQKLAPLFVMLLGRPNLPPKPIIYEFLNQFKPLSIKKHKTVNNLLVIGFNNKEDYHKILAANESKVGDATFIIKANDVVGAEKQNSEPKLKQSSDVKKDGVNTVDTEITKEVKQEDTTVNIEVKSVDKVVTIVEEQKETVIVMEATNTDATDVENNTVSEKVANNKQDPVIETILETEEDNEVQIIDNKTEEAVVTQDTKTAAKIIKETGTATPTRSSSRLTNVTPSTIKTRRASRLLNNN